MKSTWVTFGALLLSGLATTQSFGNSMVRLFAVGSNLSYKQSLKPLEFAESDANRFSETMGTVGLVPSGLNSVLTGISKDDFRSAMKRFSKQKGPIQKSKFIFYFSGHADDEGLHFKDGAVSKGELHEMLRAVPADTKVAILDSCFSGALSNKGVEEADEFELPKVEFDEPTGSVFLTASSGQQFAYESKDLGSSIFTYHLVDGLHGKADGNKDGLVTIDELYQYVYRNTKWQTMNYPQKDVQSPQYLAKLQGQGVVILSFPGQTNSDLLVSEQVAGEINIVSEKGIHFYKVKKEAGKQKIVKLPVGQYKVAVVNGENVKQTDIAIQTAKTSTLDTKDLKAESAGRNTQKGIVKEGQLTAQTDLQMALSVTAGIHTGYQSPSPIGPYFEVGLGMTSGHWLDGDIEWTLGPWMSFHRHASTSRGSGEGRVAAATDLTDQPVLGRTDSTALLLASQVTYKPLKWLLDWEPGAFFGFGQAYHFQQWHSKLETKSEAGFVPGVQYGVSFHYKVNQLSELGITIRREHMYTKRVSDKSAAHGSLIGLTTVF